MMDIAQIKRGIFCFVLIFAVIAIVQPALASNVTVGVSEQEGIAYQGAGGNYIGDTIVFDGRDTSGNVTVIKITGPNLPPNGVPVYDLTGQAGSGNIINVNQDGSWRFVWYSANIKGIGQMQTARYQFIVTDLNHPDEFATTSVMMKKPEFNVLLTPNPANFGSYVQVIGDTDLQLTSVSVEVTDQSGTLLHSYLAPVSASGYFNYGFHVDMQPGNYYVTIKNPTMVNSQQAILTVVSSLALANVTPAPGPTVLPITKGSITITSTPSGASVYLDSVMLGNTPVTLGNVSEGSHLVEIKNPGYSTYSIMVAARDGTTVTLAPALVKNSSILSLSPFAAMAGIVISALFILGRMRKQKRS